MKVRFKKDMMLGRVAVKKGDMLNVDPIFAQVLIDEGTVEKVKEKEGDKSESEAEGSFDNRNE